MSGIFGGVVAAKGASVASPLPISDQADLEISPIDSSCSVAFNTDGSMSRTGDTGTAGNWYTPTTVNIGNTHWVRLVQNSGSAPNVGLAAGTIYQLTVQRNFGMEVTGIGLRTGNFTAQIADDAAMANVLGSATFTMTAEVEV